MEKRKKRKKWPYVLAIVVLALIAVVIFVRQIQKTSEELFQYSLYTVERGSVVSQVTGTGVIAFAETASLKLPSAVRLNDVTVRAGDSVKKGEVMATLDVSSLEALQRELLSEISSLDLQLGSLQRGNTQSKVNSLVEGRVARVYCEEGDDVALVLREYGALMLLSTDGKLAASFETTAAFQKGDKAEIVRPDGKSVEGTVETVSDGAVLVTVSDGDASFGDTVKIYKDGTLYGEAVLAVNAPLTVVAQSGTVDGVKVKAGDKVRMGSLLVTLENAPYAKGYYDAYEARDEAAKTLADVRAYLFDPAVRAKEDCVVRAVYFNDGDTLSAASMGASSASTGDVALFDVGLTSSLEVLLDADELDVPLLRTGQQAKVAVNALSGNSFEAAVKSISGTGDAYNGVTSYQVRLELDPDARLLAGMNCSVTIAIEERSGVIVAPLSTIDEDANGMYTYITPSGGKQSGDRVRVAVTTGLSDGISVEILSGLSEGDVISYEDRDAMMENMMKMFGERLR